MRKMRILIAGRSKESVGAVHDLLRKNSQYRTDIRIITNGSVDPLHGVSPMPDLLILQHGAGDTELDTLVKKPRQNMPHLVVFGDGKDANAVRMAMRAGAHDFLPEPVIEQELNVLVSVIAREVAAGSSANEGDLHAFINGKGGSGASFLAANVAHGLACSGKAVTLVDLDLQFAGLCRYLDLEPERGIVDALKASEDLDEVAAEAFTTDHESGLKLLSAHSDQLVLNKNVAPEKLNQVLEFYKSFNEFVIADVPRYIDLLTASVLEQADRIMVVTQQTFPHMHDTSRLLDIVRREMGIDTSRVTVIVNRYDKNFDIGLSDIKKALSVDEVMTIPNHFKLTAESINAGIPLSEVTRSASIAKGVRNLHHDISGTEPAKEESIFSRALPALVAKGLFRR